MLQVQITLLSLPALSPPSSNVARIAVVDFDVHHGNGTQDVLCRTEHPGFLYASIHAFNRGEGDGSHARIFPGTGAADEAHGNVLNIPLGDQARFCFFVVVSLSLSMLSILSIFFTPVIIPWEISKVITEFRG